MEHLAFANESAEYHTSRNALLDAEIDLRRRIESVSALRRALPPGGTPPHDDAFERVGVHDRVEQVCLSELFEGKPSILLYSFMYRPERDRPCPGCTHMLDSIDGAVRHVSQRMPVYVVAKSPVAQLVAWARERGGSTCRRKGVATSTRSSPTTEFAPGLTRSLLRNRLGWRREGRAAPPLLVTRT